jgi:predicted MFS family arabinose efflux permease
MNAVTWSYATYVCVSVLATIWVATTLYRNGKVFLIETFQGNEALANSVNHLLVVGFYLINVGWMFLALKYGDKPTNAEQAIEFVSTKLGLVLVVLGVMHFFNLYVFSRMRRRAMLRHATPPVAPQAFLKAAR